MEDRRKRKRIELIGKKVKKRGGGLGVGRGRETYFETSRRRTPQKWRNPDWEIVPKSPWGGKWEKRFLAAPINYRGEGASEKTAKPAAWVGSLGLEGDTRSEAYSRKKRREKEYRRKERAALLAAEPE